jgi:RimJ/RimL family protein N-acetyltransferase
MAELIERSTERLRLRQWCEEDRVPFAALNADRRVMEFFPSTRDRAASDVLADRLEAHIDQRGWGFWAVERKETGEFIGFVGLHTPPLGLAISDKVEVGWRLAFQYWGKGFATEAAQCALRVGFESLGLTEIVSFTSLLNLRSRAVMERLGMVLDEAGGFEHPRVPKGNPLRPHCLFRLSRGQWIASHR